MKCQATFPKYCQFPKCDCDRGQPTEKCMSLWTQAGFCRDDTGTPCDCEIIQGNYNCKLNPF